MVVPWETQKIAIVKICCNSKSFLSKHTLFASLKFVATIYIKFTELPEFCLLGRGGLLNVSLLPKSCFRHVFFSYPEHTHTDSDKDECNERETIKEYNDSEDNNNDNDNNANKGYEDNDNDNILSRSLLRLLHSFELQMIEIRKALNVFQGTFQRQSRKSCIGENASQSTKF